VPGRRDPSTSLGRAWQVLVKELGAFGVVGAVCFALDVGLFQLLYVHAHLDAVVAKLCSTLVTVTCAYFGHRYWSFSHRARTGLRREYGLFAAINGVTLVLGLLIVWLVRHPLDQDGALVLQMANVGSIALGTVLRFTAYRRWVFVAPDHPAARSGTEGTVRTTA
jgi:putative flippase GtrA